LQLYSKYIFNKTLTAFFGISSILVCLIWFSKAISFVKYVTENGVKLSQFFYLFVLILPWILVFIIPISLFVAILIVYNRLIYSNEITILKNSGLTKLAISKPITRIVIFSSLFCYLISFYLMPYANKELRASRVNIMNNYASLAFNPQTFENINNLTIYASDRDEENNLFGIVINDQKNQDYSLTITATKGNIVNENKSVLLYMEDGTVQKHNNATKKSEILSFDNYVFNLTENKKNANKRRWKAKERYMSELLYPEDGIEENILNKFRAEIHERLTYPLFSIILPLIALSMVLYGSYNRRGNKKNIVMAIILAIAFISLIMTSYNIIEQSPKLVWIPYVIILAFGIFCAKMLNSNYRKIK